MTPLLIFALQFVTVFALGAQSLNVNGGHYRLAALTSIIISLGSLGGTWLTIVRNEPDAANIAAFIVGSILGITSAMRAHPTLVRWLGRRDQFEHHLDMVNATNALDTDPPASATQRGAERYAHEGDSAQSGRNPHSSAASHESAPQSAPNFAPIAGPSLNFPWPPLFATIDADATLITAKTRYGNQVVTMSATETAALGFGLQGICHDLAHHAGWWTRPDGSPITDNPYCFSNKLMLIVSELAEAMEGDRKGIKDDKLPHRDMREVELADAVIRIFDLAGAYNMDLGGAIAEKLYFNQRRADHKPEARAQAGGKAY